MEFHIVPFPSTICYTHCMLCLATHIACLAALNGDGDVLCLGESCSAISSGYPATTAAGSHLEGRYVNAIITHFLWCNQTQLGFQMKICHPYPHFRIRIRTRILNPEFNAHPTGFPCAFCGKTFARWAAAVLSTWKWSKIKLNYGNWKWKAKIKRIMSRIGGGSSVGGKWMGWRNPRLKQQATTVQYRIIQ